MYDSYEHLAHFISMNMIIVHLLCVCWMIQEKKCKAEGKWFRLVKKKRNEKKDVLFQGTCRTPRQILYFEGRVARRDGYMVHVWPPWVLTEVIQCFVIVDLSNFYLDVAKDRLYVGGTGSFTRRSCHTVLEAHLLSIGKIIAPILPHLAEDVWQHLPFQYTTEDGHVAKFVFESRWPEVDAEHLSFPEEEVDFWGRVLELRTEVNKALEVARSGKLIGSSLEAKVYLHCSNESLAERINKMCEPSNEADTLHRIFITSQVEILNSLQDERIKDVQYTGEHVIEEGKKKSGLVYPVQMVQNVTDAGIIHLK